MILIPILTEKSLRQAKEGHYTFWVSPFSTKDDVRKKVEKVFEVKVGSVRTMNLRGVAKKAIVTLKEGKIELFDEKGKEK